jgi:hypothetical protein
MARKIYRVLPSGSSWKLTGPAGGTLSTHSTKAPAVTAGRSAAKNDQPSQLVVHKADGTFEYEYTYGDDPYPPPG